jgi:hypothetical protein
MPTHALIVISLAWLLMLPGSVSAAGSSDAGPERWQQSASDQQLAADRRWLTLLHYDYADIGDAGSYVDDPDFFLSPDGNLDATTEMQATLRAFFGEPLSQCRFVARRSFLVGTLDGLQADLPEVECAAYDEWRSQIKADQVVLVLASSYLNSPSSMYGHTFLRFDQASVAKDTTLGSYALNFGANVADDENGLLYAWRGIGGGYPGVFSANQYLEKIKEYSRLENRDMWEYRLKLTPAEVDRMLAHIWELEQVNFDYYFFDENCSYRLLELIDAARPGLNLADNFSLWTIPVDTVRVVAEAGLVDNVLYRPSRQTVLNSRIEKLTSTEQELAYQLSGDLAVRDSVAFQSLDTTSQAKVTQVAYKYLRYEHNEEARIDDIAELSFELLRMQAGYDLPANFTAPQAEPLRPDLGHETMLVSVSGGSEDGKPFSDLEWRLSYHDLGDYSAGYGKGMSLNMGRLVLRTRKDDGLQLQRLDVIEITSLSPRDKFFKPLSWQVQTGLDRQWTDGKDELVPNVNGGAGLTYAVPGNGAVYGLLRSRLEHNNRLDQKLDIAGGARIGYLRQYGRNNTRMEAQQLWFTDGFQRTLLTLEQNFALNTNSGLRLDAKRSINDSEGTNEVSLGYRYYF